MKASEVKDMDFAEMIFRNRFQRILIHPLAWLSVSLCEQMQFLKGVRKLATIRSWALPFFTGAVGFFLAASFESFQSPHFLLRSSFALSESWHLVVYLCGDRGGRAGEMNPQPESRHSPPPPPQIQ